MTIHQRIDAPPRPAERETCASAFLKLMALREAIEATLHEIASALDDLDAFYVDREPDTDLEPSGDMEPTLGAPEQHPGITYHTRREPLRTRDGDQSIWSAATSIAPDECEAEDEREPEEDKGIDDEPHDDEGGVNSVDAEPSLAATEDIDQRNAWAKTKAESWGYHDLEEAVEGGRSASTPATSLPGVFLDPAAMPDVYGMKLVGDCLDPVLPHGTIVALDKREPVAVGDIVCLYMRAEATPAGNSNGRAKVLTATDCEVLGKHGLLVPAYAAGTINPPRVLFFPKGDVLAVHKCIGTMPDDGKAAADITPIVATAADRCVDALVATLDAMRRTRAVTHANLRPVRFGGYAD